MSMNTLGLHGLYPRSHDANACLIDSNGIAAYAEEERFRRVKKAFDLPPDNATGYCLESAGVAIGGLDVIAWGRLGEELEVSDVLPSQYVDRASRSVELKQVNHHEAHAASVFYTSPFDEAAVLVIDGQGEDESTTIWRGSPAGLEKLDTFPVEQSLGYLYGSVSRFCGLGSFGGGKLMGLAPYGRPRYLELLSDIYHSIKLPAREGHDSQDEYFTRFIDALNKTGLPIARFDQRFDPASGRTRKEPELLPVHQNLAASAQLLLEQEVLELTRRAKALTGAANLCLAGGVAMNCVTNSMVQDSQIFSDVFMQPACEDSGIGLGAALAVTKQKIPFDSVYKGPAYTDQDIEQALVKRGIRAQRQEDAALAAAQLIAQGKIVGWFQGGMEFGPRALGGRSILASPESRTMADRVNLVKGRESWRPFGPSVLAERADEMFENPHESPYMLRSFRVRDAWRARIPAVVHVDGSTRPQTVARPDNPIYYDLIDHFAELTGLPAVLNTSFNNFDEPIVATPGDAIRTFYTTGMDALVMGSWVVEK